MVRDLTDDMVSRTDLTVTDPVCAGVLFLSFFLTHQMEATYGSVTVTLTNGLLMCAGEVLSTLLVSALFKTQLLRAQVSCYHSVC